MMRVDSHRWRVAAVALCLVLRAGSAAAQAPARPDLVREVRAAIATQDFASGDQLIRAERAARGNTPEVLSALSWMGRGALAAKQFDRAEAYATETYGLATAAAKTTRLADDARLETALGASIEVLALVTTERGARSEAVAFLERELATHRDTPIHKRVQKNINVLSLAGQRAPALERGDALGAASPDLAALKGKVVLLFFWAHWCPDCKTQSPVVASTLERYRAKGFAVVAPTQRYGYIGAKENVGREEELRHIESVMGASYAFLRGEAVPVSEANLKRYGVSTTPTLVLVDRQGVVQHYRPGQMTQTELDTAVAELLAR